MKLDKVEIVNYRSIKNVTVNFDPACRVLVGINESGKSNILKALRLLSPDYDPVAKDDIREGLPDEEQVKEAYVKFYFRFEKNETNEMFEEVADKVLASAKDPEIILLDGVPTGIKSFCNQRTDVRYHVDLIKEEKEYRYVVMPTNVAFNGDWKKPSKLCPATFEVELRGGKG